MINLLGVTVIERIKEIDSLIAKVKTNYEKDKGTTLTEKDLYDIALNLARYKTYLEKKINNVEVDID